MEPSDLILAKKLARKSEDPDQLAAKICAIREVAEETGILLGQSASSALPAHDRSNITFTDENMRAAIDLLLPLSQWISPEYIAASPQGGYETKFFVAVLDAIPPGHPAPDGEEVTDILWMSPVEAAASAEDARFPMPQLYMIGELSACHRRRMLTTFVRNLNRGLFRYPFKAFRLEPAGEKCVFVLPGDHQHPIFRTVKDELFEHRGIFDGCDFRASKWSLSRHPDLFQIALEAGKQNREWCRNVSESNSKL